MARDPSTNHPLSVFITVCLRDRTYYATNSANVRDKFVCRGARKQLREMGPPSQSQDDIVWKSRCFPRTQRDLFPVLAADQGSIFWQLFDATLSWSCSLHCAGQMQHEALSPWEDEPARNKNQLVADLVRTYSLFIGCTTICKLMMRTVKSLI